MCGVCGVALADGAREVALDRLQRMTQAIRFRGPDAEGHYRAPGIGLGHRRLSVIDLAGGAQPMSDPWAQVTICFNGEIYNFRGLRRDLEAAGHTFRTHSDSEVLLRGYLQWGEAVLDRLVGMFAMALWDAGREVLLLARDRLGVKPLYWASLPDGGLVFGSELTAILASELIGPRLNLSSVVRYLALGYVPGPESILEGIQRLPAGHLLRWPRGGPPQVRPYWNLTERWLAAAQQPWQGDPVERFGEALDTAVRERLISDVPLGVLLSGGVDSTAVTALMCRHQSGVRTFSCGFAEASYSELSYARLAAEALGTVHEDEILRCDSPELLLEIAARLDEPLADTSLVPTYALCRMARQQVTVALSGDGGDELLAGYVTHVADRCHQVARRLPRWLLTVARRASSWLPDSRRKVSLPFKIKQFWRGADLDLRDAHAWWRMLARPEDLRPLFHSDLRIPDVSPFTPFRVAYEEAAGLPPLDRMLHVDYRTWLVDDILVKVDRASMGHGLEVRSPFLDHRLFELCAGLPAHWKLRGVRRKVVLLEAMRRHVPAAILSRRKAGFNAPVSHWISHAWRDVVETHLGNGSLRSAGVLAPGRVRQLLDEHLGGRRDHGYLLFALLQLSLWLEKVRPGIRD